MMTRLQYLLSKLAEECTEVGQIVLKTQQFGLEEQYPKHNLNNKFRIHQELNDILGVVEMLNRECDFNFVPIPKEIEAKMAKINKYYDYSAHLGMVEPRKRL